MQIAEDNGEVRHVLIDHEGDSRLLAGEDFPAAVMTDITPCVGVGVRRKSALGPHLGAGLGGKWKLTGDVIGDRDAEIQTLRKLISQVERGDLDDLLTIERPIRQNRETSQEHLRHTLADYRRRRQYRGPPLGGLRRCGTARRPRGRCPHRV